MTSTKQHLLGALGSVASLSAKIQLLGLVIAFALGAVGMAELTAPKGYLFFCAAGIPMTIMLGVRLWRSSGESTPVATRRSHTVSRWGIGLLAAFFLTRALGGLIAPGFSDTYEADSAALASTFCAAALFLGLVQDGGSRALVHDVLILLTGGLATLQATTKILASVTPLTSLTGNSGYDLQIMLPGACLGLWHLTRGTSRMTWASVLAVVSTSTFAVLEPVVGGVLILAGMALLTTVLPRDASSPQLARPLTWFSVGILLFSLSLSMGGSQINPVDREPSQSVAVETPEAGDWGGVGVRTLIWGTIPALVRDFPMGVGTGQFMAAYPPYRDVREIELSTHHRKINEIVEVEHPHNDLVFAFAEQGISGGLLFGLGWLAAVAGVGLCLFRKTANQATGTGADSNIEGCQASGFAALALLGNCLFHSPLMTNFLAGPIGLFLLALSQPRFTSRGQRWFLHAKASAVLMLGTGGLILIQATNAWSLARHDDELWGAWGKSFPPLLTLEDALVHRSDSFQAHAAIARRDRAFAELGDADDQVDMEAPWTAALAIRPHSIEALVGLGLVRVQKGDLLGTLDLWRHARDLDPGYPVVVGNLKRLGADLVLTGELESGIRELAPELFGEGATDDSGNPIDLGSALLAMASDQESVARVAAARNGDDPDLHSARALTCAAQWTWGREHATNGDFATALRSYRQARRETARQPIRLAPRLDFEYAALLQLTGDGDGAKAIWAQLSSSPGGTQALSAEAPQWARTAFEAL
jgi:O-antigen ligase